MLRKGLWAALVLLFAGGLGAATRGEEEYPPARNKTFVDQVGSFGRGVWGVIAGTPAQAPARTAPTEPAARPYPRPAETPVRGDAWSLRESNTVRRPNTSSARAVVSNDASAQGQTAKPDSTTQLLAAPERASGVSTLSVAGSEDARAVRKTETTAVRETASGGSTAEGLSVPMHERLQMLRSSPFPTSSVSTRTTTAEPKVTSPAEPIRSVSKPASTLTPEQAPYLRSGAADGNSAAAKSTVAGVAGPLTAGKMDESLPATKDRVAPSTATAVSPGTTNLSPALPDPAAGLGRMSRSAEPLSTVPKAQAVPVDSKPLAGAATAPVEIPSAVVEKPISTRDSSPNLLVSRQGPNLSVETTGPKRISVGRVSNYEVTIVNSSEASAEDVLVSIDLPPWAEVSAADATVGSTQVVAPPPGGQRQVHWKVGRMDGKAQQRLTLRIIPRESRPIELAIHWDVKHSATQAAIEVQEPKLVVRLEGPRQVHFSRKELYRLKIANVGNGDAENTLVRIVPVGTGETAAAAQGMGTLAAGQERTVELELTARQPGTLTVKVQAQCDGGAAAELSESFVVRQPKLQVEVQGPQLQFVDAVSAYKIRVSNPGSAPARRVEVTATLPPGTKLISASEGGQAAAQGNSVAWRLESLEATSDSVFEFKCSLTQPGTLPLQVSAHADEELAATTSFSTRVEAVADLAMEVTDPARPVALGEEAVYEIRLLNRGSKSAEQLEVSAFFSQGIEPVSADGSPHKIAPGQVAFNTIPTLGAGQELRLKIRARAQAAGSHIFRAEMHCRPLAARLVREETTHFYATDGSAAVPQIGAAAVPPGSSLRGEQRPSAAGTVPFVSDSTNQPVPTRTTR